MYSIDEDEKFEHCNRLKAYVETGLLAVPFKMEEWVRIISDEDLLHFYKLAEEVVKCIQCQQTNGLSKCNSCPYIDNKDDKFKELSMMVFMLAQYEIPDRAIQYAVNIATHNFLCGIEFEAERRYGDGIISGDRSVLGVSCKMVKRGDPAKVDEKIALLKRGESLTLNGKEIDFNKRRHTRRLYRFRGRGEE